VPERIFNHPGFLPFIRWAVNGNEKVAVKVAEFLGVLLQTTWDERLLIVVLQVLQELVSANYTCSADIEFAVTNILKLILEPEASR
jgi:hypothetical protein